MKAFTSFFVLSAVVYSALARPAPQASKSFTKQNGIDALNQNKQFQTLSADSSCTSGENACVNQEFAQCVNGKFVLTPCSSGLICAALPLVNSAGTSITCTTQSDVDARIAATGATNGDATDTTATSSSSTKKSTSTKSASSTAASATADASNNNGNTGDLQTSLCLDPSLVQTGFEKDGQETPAAGQVASITSSNNYINFCATTKLPLTNGQQVKGGSCNAAPMGIIASVSNMPSSKFVFPLNTDTIKANTAFTVKMAVRGLTTGNFVNAAANYFSGPQQVDGAGNIVGHSHIVIEKVNGMRDTSPTDPTKFAFFKGLNDVAQGGILSADVTDGLPAGTYRIASINSAANHQPVLVAVAQHGSLDDMVYFTVTANGRQTNNDVTASSVVAAPPTATTSVSSSKTKGSSKSTVTTSSVEEAATTSVGTTSVASTSVASNSVAASTSVATSSAASTSAASDDEPCDTTVHTVTVSPPDATSVASASASQITEIATGSSSTRGSKNVVSSSSFSSSVELSNTSSMFRDPMAPASSTVTRNAVKATSTASASEDCDY